jgi:hypothetical protein
VGAKGWTEKRDHIMDCIYIRMFRWPEVRRNNDSDANKLTLPEDRARCSVLTTSSW